MKVFVRSVGSFFAALPPGIAWSYVAEGALRSLVKFQLVFCLSVSGALAQTKYKIVPIPTSAGSTSSALSLNENGQVVGYSFKAKTTKLFSMFIPAAKSEKSVHLEEN